MVVVHWLLSKLAARTDRGVAQDDLRHFKSTSHPPDNPALHELLQRVDRLKGELGTLESMIEVARARHSPGVPRPTSHRTRRKHEEPAAYRIARRLLAEGQTPARTADKTMLPLEVVLTLAPRVASNNPDVIERSSILL